MTTAAPPPSTSFQLRVVEAQTRDVGRGIARLDPRDIERLGAAVGDVVAIVGQRRTVARIMPAFPEQRGQQLIQIDGLLRANAGVGVDDRVTVERCEATTARSITLVAQERNDLGNPAQSRYLARLLDRIAVTEGDLVRINLLGTRAQSFLVRETQPGGAVIINQATIIRLNGPSEASEPSRAAIAYEDVGGLRRELRRIREMIELPLRFPEVFSRLGIDPPRGVLLHGPPGTGKTLIARAVAHETSAHFLHINGPEIIDKWYGASEANLRNIFEEARRRAPAIIFIDEIDAIAPRREEMTGDRQIERRVVAQLLTLMDGLDPRGNVMVIAATNIPNTLDPALRRPGRFDRELQIGAPDREGRHEILEIHTRGMPLADDVDLVQIAATTHGFVGADLQALAREAALCALRRIAPDFDFGHDQPPLEALLNLQVTGRDFASARNEVEPSAIREVFTEVSDTRWEDVGGLDEIKASLIETVEWPLRHEALFARSGLRPPRGVLLYGAPGTGKTLLARALAARSEANFIAVRGPQLLSKWVGESERSVREVFRKARLAAPCIIFFDELDALVSPRGPGGQPDTGERIVSQLLVEMDGLDTLRGVVVLAATNRLDRIDPALLRPGRFDLVVEMPFPSQATRAAIFAIHTRNTPLAEDVDCDELARVCEGFSGAEIEGLCRRAILAAVRERILSNDLDPSRLLVRRSHFSSALDELPLLRRSGSSL